MILVCQNSKWWLHQDYFAGVLVHTDNSSGNGLPLEGTTAAMSEKELLVWLQLLELQLAVLIWVAPTSEREREDIGAIS